MASSLGRVTGGGLVSALIALSCNHQTMGPVIYLALVGGGLVAAAAISFVLRGIKLI